MAKSSNNKNNTSKKNNVKDNKKNNSTNKQNISTNSKYNRYEKQSSKSNTKNKSADIEFLEDLDSTRNLDDSFIEGLRKRKVVEQKTEILDVDEINKANLEYKNNIDLNKRLIICNYLLFIFVLISLVSVSFICFHFISFDHKKVKVIKEEVIKEVKVVDDNYVFLGDSITEFYDLNKYYGDMPIIKSGVAGYTTNDLLKRLDKFVYQYNPSKVFILIGTNDLGKEVSNDIIISNIEKIIDNIKENRPYAKIYLQSIYPINDSNIDGIGDYVSDGNRNNEEICKVNSKLEELAKDKEIVYIDIYSKLIDENNLLDIKYTYDGLHISNDGYELITSILKEYL